MAAPNLIPGRIVLGVTGTRSVQDGRRLGAAIRDVLSRLQTVGDELEATEVHFTLLSPLAEGADRQVAQEVLLRDGGRVEAVLPLPPDDYRTDFETVESRDEFDALVDASSRTTVLTRGVQRNEAYEAAGHYVVEHCDALIAIWDGGPAAGRGGTAEIVEYARRLGRPLYWINATDPDDIREERTDQIGAGRFKVLNAFNRADPKGVAEAEAAFRDGLETAADAAGMSRGRLAGIEPLIGVFARADLAAQRYQKRYVRAGVWVYALAAGAVAAASIALIWHIKLLHYVEVAFILLILWLVFFGNRRKWQQRWIDYRFLAERLRTTIYLHPAGLGASDVELPRHLSLAYSSNDWMMAAFREAAEWVTPPAPPAENELDPVRRFMLSAWVDDQIGHHRKAAHRFHRRNRAAVITGTALFAVTSLVAMANLIPDLPEWLVDPFSLVSIALPAVGASIAAIRGHQELHRNSLRAEEMVRHLTEIRGHIEAAPTTRSLLGALEEAEQTMVNENADWRVVVRFHELEPPS